MSTPVRPSDSSTPTATPVAFLSTTDPSTRLGGTVAPELPMGPGARRYRPSPAFRWIDRGGRREAQQATTAQFPGQERDSGRRYEEVTTYPSPPARADPTARESRPRWVVSAVLGGFGAALLALASDLPASPYGPHAAGLWPLAARGPVPGWEGPTVPGWAMLADQGPGVGSGRLLLTLAVLAGIGLMAGAWILVWRSVGGQSGRWWRRLWWTVGAWATPLLFGAPFASQDVWHYGAEGEMVLRGYGGYRPSTLLGHSIWTAGVDHKWAARPSLYGPAGINLSALFDKISGGRPWVAAECWRVSALFGVILAAWGVQRLVASRNGNTRRAVLAGVCNPAVLIVLVASIHNDALMIGLVVSGIALAMSDRRSTGMVVCALGVAVKPNALLAVGALAWWAWSSGLRERFRGVAVAALSLTGVLLVTGINVGGGFGWMRSVISYPWLPGPWSLAAQLFGVNAGRAIDAVELAGTLTSVALVLGVRRSAGWIVALGWGFAALAVTTPTPEPWYLSWALVLIACGGLERPAERVGLLALAGMMIGAGLPFGVLWWFEGAVVLGTLGVLCLRSHLHPTAAPHEVDNVPQGVPGDAGQTEIEARQAPSDHPVGAGLLRR
ncbi:MAG: polyprenol phosphomannose-dependent alpha 1,6 mannosyltransferase MptB [Acidimicrobiales bacterium]